MEGSGGGGEEVALDSYTLSLFSIVGFFFFQLILSGNLFFDSYFFLTLK